jgi:hypothetical protein
VVVEEELKMEMDNLEDQVAVAVVEELLLSEELVLEILVQLQEQIIKSHHLMDGVMMEVVTQEEVHSVVAAAAALVQ